MATANLKQLEKITAAIDVETASRLSPRAANPAERRQVTVMFSDLVGSTGLGLGWIQRTCERPSRRSRRRSLVLAGAVG
jgi:hypothetical protein